MFNFTNTIRYSLRLLVNLSLSGKMPKQMKKIAEEEGISLSYLRKIIVPLERSQIVKSVRGPGGGFLLNRNPSRVSLSEIVEVLGYNKAAGCVKGLSECRRYEDCLVKDLLEEVYNKVQTVFKAKTLAAVIKGRKR